MINSEFSLIFNSFGEIETKIIIATEDATVSANEPNNNFGDENQLQVGIEFDVLEAFIKFDFSNAPKKIEEAFLELEVNRFATYNSLEIYETPTNWSEYTITWNTAPEPGIRVAYAFIGGLRIYSFDITKALLGDQDSFSFCLTYPYQWIGIASRECSSEYSPPQIIFFFAVDAFPTIFTSIFVGIITASILGLILHKIYYKKEKSTT
ncbi:MAG: DNRLRE domain-containing protein [Promethearchaeota archaeon]